MSKVYTIDGIDYVDSTNLHSYLKTTSSNLRQRITTDYVIPERTDLAEFKILMEFLLCLTEIEKLSTWTYNELENANLEDEVQRSLHGYGYSFRTDERSPAS